MTDGLGEAAWDVAIPNVPAWAGLGFYQQFVVLDGGANKLGATFSNAGRATMGIK